MKISKEIALKTIRDAELTTYLMYTSGVVDHITYLQIWNGLQHLNKIAEKSTLSEFEGAS